MEWKEAWHMTYGIPMRRWATPIAIGSFLLMSITGIAMFFDWEPGLVTVVHQWMSWIFLFALAVHIAVNIRPFKSHIRSSWGRGSIAIFGLLLAASFYHWGLVTGPQMKDRIELTLVDARLSALADVVGSEPAKLVRRFEENGLAVSAEQSIRDLVHLHHVDENILLAIVFMPERFKSTTP